MTVDWQITIGDILTFCGGCVAAIIFLMGCYSIWLQMRNELRTHGLAINRLGDEVAALKTATQTLIRHDERISSVERRVDTLENRALFGTNTNHV